MNEDISKGKYLLLYLKTGGGHLAPARSIAAYLQKNDPEIMPVLIDGLQEAPSYARFIVEDGYRILQSRAKWYYEMLYATNKISSLARWNSYLVSDRVKPFLKEKILNTKLCKIVIFHFFLIKPVYEILEENGLDIPVITVVTDPFTAHPMWFIQKDQNYVVFSERLKEHMLKKQIPSDNIHVFPFILNDRFSTPAGQEEIPSLKEKYGFDPNKKVVLIMGGGDGIPKGEAILRSLMKDPVPAQIAIVCGRNKKLYDYAMKLKNKGNFMDMKVYGYIDFVYELLNISDVVITKCGASTFMEILMTGKIPVVNDYIWEQEKGNVEFLVKNQLGIFEKSVRRLPAVINRLLTDKEFFSLYQNNIKNAGLKNGTTDVARFIASFQD